MAGKIDVTARCVKIDGDQEEFSDMLGASGRLFLDGDNNWFSGGQGVEMKAVRKSRKGDTIKVKTKMGNTFTFKVLA